MHRPVPLVLFLIADDLTGALDSAVPFANLGLSVSVLTRPDADPAMVSSDCLAISINSREGSVTEAARLAHSVCRIGTGARFSFKKIDSRLKGHVAEEVRAVARALGLTRILLSPAIPSMGRRVRNGHLCGTAVAEPIPLAPIVSALAEFDVLAPEIETDADLDRAVSGAGEATLFVGARGLASALARRIGPTKTAKAPQLFPPVQFVIGSRDPVTVQQVARLRSDRPGLPYLAAPNGLSPTLPEAGAFVLQAVEGVGSVSGCLVSERLADAVVSCMTRPGTVVVTGGETAAAVLQRAGLDRLCVLGEVLPGVPVCGVAGQADFRLVTKSGGFGAVDAFVRLGYGSLDESALR